MKAEPTGQHRYRVIPTRNAWAPPALTATHLLAHKEAGSHSQPMSEVVYGIGQQVEIATDLSEGRESRVKPDRKG